MKIEGLTADELQIIVRSLENHADLIEAEIAKTNTLCRAQTAEYFTATLRSGLLETKVLMDKVQEALDNQINL